MKIFPSTKDASIPQALTLNRGGPGSRSFGPVAGEEQRLRLPGSAVSALGPILSPVPGGSLQTAVRQRSLAGQGFELSRIPLVPAAGAASLRSPIGGSSLAGQGGQLQRQETTTTTTATTATATTATATTTTTASPEAAANPLDATQVTQAIQFYQRRPDQYTPAILQEIQTAVGVTASGTVDEAMVQAVARWQAAHPPLWVDGMAGPRTLPALFPGGLAAQGEIDTFTGDARSVLTGDWGSKSQEERADEILAKVNLRLAAAGVPEVGRSLQDLGDDVGQFDFTVWTLLLGEAAFSNDALSEAEAADLADTIYHEARHAEQWYRIAQLLACEGKGAQAIADEMGIPARIAALAAANPLTAGSTEALIADGWYQSIYGVHSSHRERVLGPSGTYQEYRDLPEESDAWRVGGAVTEAYGRRREEETP